MIDLLIKLADRFFLVDYLWSLLPNRCIMNPCPGNIYRWTEDEIVFAGGPLAGKGGHICSECANKLRQLSFKSGHSVVHHENGWTEYVPMSESEESEPLEQ